MEHLQTSLFPTPPQGRLGNRPLRGRTEAARGSHRLQPMIPVAGELPADQWRYGFELRWNGARTLSYFERGQLNLQTSGVESALDRYPELLALAEMVGARRLTLDGEIVAAGAGGRPDPARLQARTDLMNQGHFWRAVEEIPITYIIFDILNLDGRDTTGLPYHHRRELLESLELIGPNWDTPPYLEEEGSALLQACRQRRLDGVLAKRIDSPYEPGRRSRSWVKIRIRPRQRFLICGAVPQMENSDAIESLLLGVYGESPTEDGDSETRLQYVGIAAVGTSAAEQTELRQRLSGLQRQSPPFGEYVSGAGKAATFFEPLVTCEAEFAEWTPLGTVKQATVVSFPEGTDPRGVVRE